MAPRARRSEAHVIPDGYSLSGKKNTLLLSDERISRTLRIGGLVKTRGSRVYEGNRSRISDFWFSFLCRVGVILDSMNRREFLKMAATCAATVAMPHVPTAGAASTARKQTNIILIMIDDLGWMDLHCQGNERLDTPNIDKLASQGMRFTDAYAAAPVCSPTRAAIMTGQSPARLRITNHLPDREQFQPDDAKLRSAMMLEHLSLEHVTLAERLRDGGYATAFLGKWHLSGQDKDGDFAEPKLRPEHQGFDVNVGGCGFGGPPSYFEPYRIPNITPRREGEYLPDRLADEAIDFVRANRRKPFFVALWNYTVHWPMQLSLIHI